MYSMINPYQMQFQQNPIQPVKQELIRVNGIDGARAYQMQPNSTVALFDAGCDVMYIKQTDGAGFPSIRSFEFAELKEQTKQEPSREYVTREEFDQLTEKINTMLKGGANNGKQFVPERK